MSIQKSKAKADHLFPIIFGDWDNCTIRIDFDNDCLVNVKYWAKRACYWHKLDGFIILQSSKRHYHVVFNKTVTWATNVKVICWIALESGNLNLQKYALMQGIKKTSTLRIGNKGNKKPPKIISRYGNQDKQISNFLDNRKFILNSIKKLEKEAILECGKNAVT
jgi:hypothetical protein